MTAAVGDDDTVSHGGALIGTLCTVFLWSFRRYLEPLLEPLLRVARRLHLG